MKQFVTECGGFAGPRIVAETREDAEKTLGRLKKGRQVPPEMEIVGQLVSEEVIKNGNQRLR